MSEQQEETKAEDGKAESLERHRVDMWAQAFIVACLLLSCLAAGAMDSHELAAMLGGAAVALVLPRVPTAARVAVVGAVMVLGTAGCGAVDKPAVRNAVRLGCEVADWALSGEECVPERDGE